MANGALDLALRPRPYNSLETGLKQSSLDRSIWHYMVGTHSTVEKRAKRMPDTTVETTSGMSRFSW